MRYYKKDIIPKTELVSNNNNLKFDWGLYKKLLSFRSHSKSKNQDEFRDWLYDWVEKNIKNVLVQQDKYGNLYVTKGSSDLYPCIVAHLDINQDEDIKNFSIIQTDKFIIGLDNETGKQCGLGHDDKAGVYFALLMLQTLDVVKCFFSLNEEIGCRGTREAIMSFFKDCTMLVQLDRNSFSNDISEYTNGTVVVSEEFKKASSLILHNYNYKYKSCVYTDIGELINQGTGCVAMNISSGYFNEHCDDEVLSIPHYINAMNFGYSLIANLGYEKRWEFNPLKLEYKSKNYYEDYYDWRQENVSSVIEEYYHHCEHWQFNEQDEQYVVESTDIGECPVCQGSVIELDAGEQVCSNCESIFFIPVGKTIESCLQEYNDLKMQKSVIEEE